eukprot:7843298-Prorocentrum_lima.AAC.1
MATPMMQPGVVTFVASSGQRQVRALTAPTGQETVDQPMETPLTTKWNVGMGVVRCLWHTRCRKSSLQIHT